MLHACFYKQKPKRHILREVNACSGEDIEICSSNYQHVVVFFSDTVVFIITLVARAVLFGAFIVVSSFPCRLRVSRVFIADLWLFSKRMSVSKQGLVTFPCC